MAAKVRPIKPGEVVKLKAASIPDVVYDMFNQLIAKKFDGHSAHVKQEDVVVLLVESGFKRDEIFENHWLDVEGAYRSVGWKVEYDKPAYCESYEPFFVFSR